MILKAFVILGVIYIAYFALVSAYNLILLLHEYLQSRKSGSRWDA